MVGGEGTPLPKEVAILSRFKAFIPLKTKMQPLFSEEASSTSFYTFLAT